MSINKSWYNMIKTAQAVPAEYALTRSSPYVYSVRLLNSVTRADAEYVVRVYYFASRPPAAQWAVIGFNGSRGANLVQQFKGSYSSRVRALEVADRLVEEKIGRRYRIENRTVTYEDSPRLPGVHMSGPVGRAAPAPATVRRPLVPATPTMDAIPMPTLSELIRSIHSPNLNCADLRLAAIMNIKGKLLADDYAEEALMNTFVRWMLTSRPEYRQEILTFMMEDEFDKIEMPAEYKEIVRNHFHPNASPQPQVTPPAPPQETTPEEPPPPADPFSGSSLSGLFANRKHWFGQIVRKAKEELRGYFKYNIVSDPNEVGSYNIYWRGVGDDVQIEKHNMPPDLFREHLLKIMGVAKEQSVKYYNELRHEKPVYRASR